MCHIKYHNTAALSVRAGVLRQLTRCTAHVTTKKDVGAQLYKICDRYLVSET